MYLNNILKVFLLLAKGVEFSRPLSVQIKGKLIVGNNNRIGSNVIFSGLVELGDDVKIEDNCILEDCKLSNNSLIKAGSLIENSSIGENSFIGPFARVRASTRIDQECQIGNFVEIKNSLVGDRVRINHMAFIGDAFLEEDVTIGAGVITCNHDGKKVNETFIRRGAYIGSNSNLIAPVEIGENSMIGSGSSISEDVPAEKLVIARSRQIEVSNRKGFDKSSDK